jgi:hypothetical protein
MHPYLLLFFSSETSELQNCELKNLNFIAFVRLNMFIFNIEEIFLFELIVGF